MIIFVKFWLFFIEHFCFYAYNITDDNVRNRIKDFAPQMANYYKGHIGFTVDVNDFGAANTYYESNKDEFDELYRSLGVSFERTL